MLDISDIRHSDKLLLIAGIELENTGENAGRFKWGTFFICKYKIIYSKVRLSNCICEVLS